MCYSKKKKKKEKKGTSEIREIDHIMGLSYVFDEAKSSPNVRIRQVCLENIIRKRLEANLTQPNQVMK